MNETPTAQEKSQIRGLQAPEPWRMEVGDRNFDLFAKDGKRDYLIYQVYGRGIRNAEANASRIVSCVNALAGVQNPAAIPKLVMQSRRIQNSINEAAPADLRVIFESADLINFKAALASLDSSQTVICPQNSTTDDAGRVSSN